MKLHFFIAFLIFSVNGQAQDSLKADYSIKKMMNVPTHGYFAIDSIKYSNNSLDNIMIAQDPSIGILTNYEAGNLNTDSTTLKILSIVDRDSTICKNWNKFIEQFKDENYLILLTNTDDVSKQSFLNYYFEQRSQGFDIKKSYELTVNKFEKTHPSLRHLLNIKK